MGIIDTEEAAKRLARVILSDIELYHRERPKAGEDLSAAIEEGRNLFRSRVAPELVPLFATVLADRRKGASNPAPAPVATAAVATPAVVPAPAPAPAPAPVSPPAIERDTVASMPVFPMETTPAPEALPTPVPAAVVTPALAAEAEAEAVTPVPEPTAAVAPLPTTTVAAAPAAAAPVPASPAPRKGLLDTEETAARLARVIVSDIQIYNAAKIASGADLSFEINEGRTLFKSRVIPDLAGAFEEALAAKGLADRRRSREARRPPVAESRPAPSAAPLPASRTPVAPARPAAVARPLAAPEMPLPAARQRLFTPASVPAAAATPLPSGPIRIAAPARPPVTPEPERIAPVAVAAPQAPDDADIPTPEPEMLPAREAAFPAPRTTHPVPAFLAPTPQASPTPQARIPTAASMSSVKLPSAPPAQAPVYGDLQTMAPASTELAALPETDLRPSSKSRWIALAVIVALAAIAGLVYHYVVRAGA